MEQKSILTEYVSQTSRDLYPGRRHNVSVEVLACKTYSLFCMPGQKENKIYVDSCYK